MFYIHTTDKGCLYPFEYLPASAGSYTPGLALVQKDGSLTVASGTTAPAYICAYGGTVDAGTEIPVIRIQDDQIWETTFSAAATAVKLGNKVTLSADGDQVTGTTTGGVAEVVYMADTAADSVVRVRF
jgi:hypothetical protein